MGKHKKKPDMLGYIKRTVIKNPIYLLASRLNGKEYVVVNPKAANTAAFAWVLLQELKGELKHFYDITFISDPRQHMFAVAKLVEYHPVIVHFQHSRFESIMKEWGILTVAYNLEQVLLKQPHAIVEMRKGFIEKFQRLDVVKEIERTVGVNPDGSMRVNKFTVSRSYLGEESTLKPFTEEMGMELLKERKLI